MSTYRSFTFTFLSKLLFICPLVTLFSLPVLFSSCGEKRIAISMQERKTLDSIIRAAPDIDSLTILKYQMKQNGNQLGYVIALREMGKRLRNESRFDEALKVHSEGLKLAEDIVDTLEMVQALNNIGTIYRRLGVLNTATDYHYRAWKMSEECTDTTFVGKKNRVVSLNGLGNVYMTLGNYERADSVLRMALEGEKALKSPIGQAINYANLGSIFIQQNNLDSAWVCYRHSMRLNQAAKNTLGISLCHTYFGLLYEKTRHYDKAIDEYNQAFELMKASKDEWHALGTLLSLAGIHIDMGDYAATFGYLR
ncbi:tetratricopeptide repeat protein [Hoylesella saccharolytica]|uniref:tetratricopeptide repeat protein n=1 Tax=Hoylesella saccharolytica TaxID=633701 RepID=UPI0028E2EF6D|nr:tetratricopeptide repeat protein [Hoylesella saccharolytica]